MNNVFVSGTCADHDNRTRIEGSANAQWIGDGDAVSEGGSEQMCQRLGGPRLFAKTETA